jgi:hypothetical protein
VHREGVDFTEILKIMTIAAAAVGVISVFMTWFSLDYVIIQFDYTGYEFFTKQHGYPDSGYFIYAPLVVLAASSAALISAVLSFVKHERKCSIGVLVTGLSVLISALLYAFYPESKIRLL